MKIRAVIHSSFPRIGEHPDEQKLRRANASLDEGKISFEEFSRVQDQLIDEIIRIQESAGIEILTDGLIRRYDPASHLVRNMQGFEINGLLRFFDTNFYYRQPVALDDIAAGNGGLADEIGYIARKTEHEVKAVMLGPLTLAAMSLNKSSLKFEELCHKMGAFLGAQAAKMVTAGASVIQVEEPWLVRHPERFELYLSCFNEFRENTKGARLIMAFYFGDCGRIYERLNEIPADMLGIDFTYSPGLLDKMMSDGFAMPLAFGVLDGRNTKLENAGQIAKAIEPIIKKSSVSDYQITTSCGLEFLPRQYAIRKLELTAQIAKLLNG